MPARGNTSLNSLKKHRGIVSSPADPRWHSMPNCSPSDSTANRAIADTVPIRSLLDQFARPAVARGAERALQTNRSFWIVRALFIWTPDDTLRQSGDLAS